MIHLQDNRNVEDLVIKCLLNCFQSPTGKYFSLPNYWKLFASYLRICCKIWFDSLTENEKDDEDPCSALSRSRNPKYFHRYSNSNFFLYFLFYRHYLIVLYLENWVLSVNIWQNQLFLFCKHGRTLNFIIHPIYLC